MLLNHTHSIRPHWGSDIVFLFLFFSVNCFFSCLFSLHLWRSLSFGLPSWVSYELWSVVFNLVLVHLKWFTIASGSSCLLHKLEILSYYESSGLQFFSNFELWTGNHSLFREHDEEYCKVPVKILVGPGKQRNRLALLSASCSAQGKLPYSFFSSSILRDYSSSIYFSQTWELLTWKRRKVMGHHLEEY